ncbi:hypothetical protein M413DRAFT_33262, partial [Hebeloma cylindrosporum]
VSSPTPGPYAGWTRERLIERLTELEGTTTGPPQLPSDIPNAPAAPSPIITPSPPSKAPEKPFDFSKHSRRKIALKFCYSGWEYGGLAFQLGPTPLPTVENVLFDVLAKTRLVDPDGGFDGCGWEKCGRTDRGVSAAGQVVSLWPNTNSKHKQELDYLVMLNRLLPDTIRVIAWSPVSDSFSARFSCKYRHYKYFFPSTHLDVAKMQAAADRMVGEHDFRNLCKLDAQKQITSFRRKILRASISPLEEDDRGTGQMHVFDLVGSAFLYHQVRHIMAVLFLVGSGLEPPSVVTELMNVEEGIEPLRPEDTDKYAIIDRKPEYQMADALPLMLWACGYDESELSWRTSGKPDDTDAGNGDLYNQLENIHSRSRVFSALDRHFLKAVERHHPAAPPILPLKDGPRGLEALKRKPERERVMNVPLGGGTFKRHLKYVPLLERKRLDTVEVMNERWRLGKGLRKDEKRRAEDSSLGQDDDGNE